MVPEMVQYVAVGICFLILATVFDSRFMRGVLFSMGVASFLVGINFERFPEGVSVHAKSDRLSVECRSPRVLAR